MENNVSGSHVLEGDLSSCCSTITNEIANHQEPNGQDTFFVDQAAVAWNAIRKKWIGDRPKRPHKETREPIISWCTSYDDLLSTSQPFPQPIPLSEMVDFLVDIWNEDGF